MRMCGRIDPQRSMQRFTEWGTFAYESSGLGQDNSASLNLSKYSGNLTVLLDSFKRAGFADATLNEYNLRPCPLGTFVNVSRLECVECPAGGFYSDTIAFVNDSCLRCPNGTFVPYTKAPGKSARECVACPQGKHIL
ncbi:unnamed protein product [Porites evermanni]|uniref:Tyrosine-protein kinase ephrin type A/B receptor-like domain-containing protein n=1 Tax=Porites evermanni TaxID=104178 RepID=A0ABN8SWQ5_9CNID|nr:unnamed protein product [Porites evermanni]